MEGFSSLGEIIDEYPFQSFVLALVTFAVVTIAIRQAGIRKGVRGGFRRGVDYAEHEIGNGRTPAREDPHSLD